MNSFSDILKCIAFATLIGLSAEAADITGKVTGAKAPNNANSVVYIYKIPGKTFPPPTATETMDQFNLKFEPHVLVIRLGTRVAFPNSDVVRHNVFSPGPIQKFQLGTYRIGQTVYKVFDKPGIVTLLCNIHAEMSAYIVVTETPYWAISNADGDYTIPNVPPGRYVLRVWNEKSEKTPPREITVGNSDLKGMNFELKR